MTIKNKPLKGIREETSQAPRYFFPVVPTTTDKKDRYTNKRYEVGSFGIIGQNPINGIAVRSGTTGQYWYLSKFDSNGDAIWLPFSSGGSGPLIQLDIDANTVPGTDPVTPAGDGTFNLNGAVVAAHGVPIETHSRALNSCNIEIQVGSAVTGAPGNKNAVGSVQFDDTAFDVDEHGYVTLKGGSGPAIDSITVDQVTAPGVNPVTPTGAGLVTVSGAIVDAHSVPLETRSRALNAWNIEAQVGSAVTGAPGNKNAVGMLQLDDTKFSVDSHGYTTLIGGAGAGFTWREETGTSATFVDNEGIFANNASTVTLTLPSSCTIGHAFAAYQEGAGKVRIAQNASDQIRFEGFTTTVGVGGYIESLNQGDSVIIICKGSNAFGVIASEGSWTVV